MVQMQRPGGPAGGNQKPDLGTAVHQITDCLRDFALPFPVCEPVDNSGTLAQRQAAELGRSREMRKKVLGMRAFMRAVEGVGRGKGNPGAYLTLLQGCPEEVVDKSVVLWYVQTASQKPGEIRRIEESLISMPGVDDRTRARLVEARNHVHQLVNSIANIEL